MFEIDIMHEIESLSINPEEFSLEKLIFLSPVMASELLKIQEEKKKLMQAVLEAAKTFEFYAKSYASKLTPEDDIEASKNLKLAEYMRNTLKESE